MHARASLVLLALLVAGAAAKSCATCSWPTDTFCTGDCGGLASKSDDWCDNTNHCCCENEGTCDCCCKPNVGAIAGVVVAVVVVVAVCIAVCCFQCPSCACAQRHRQRKFEHQQQQQMRGQPPVALLI